VLLLLNRGADIHARARGGMYFWADVEAIDVAIWGNGWHRREPGLARLLLERGATYDLAVAAALGDIDRVTAILDAEPARIRETRPSGRRPLSAAIEHGHDAIAHLLLDRGANPNWEEPTAPHGRALHAAAGAGMRALVERMLTLGADPSSGIDSSGNAVTAAATPEIRALLVSHGGEIDPYDTTWIDDDEELRRVANQTSVTLRVETAFPMVVGSKRPDHLTRLFDAGIKVPPVITGCQGYLLGSADMLRTLLDHGMSPDLHNWQHQTLLHWAAKGNIELAAMLLDAGANLSARDDEYLSTPLGWAARAGAVPSVEFLLARGAQPNDPGDPEWATPLAWATRRGHEQVASILRSHGATR
jgi:ankyrin repeat protein